MGVCLLIVNRLAAQMRRPVAIVFFGRDGIPAREPAMEIHISAAFGAKWHILLHGLGVAYGTAGDDFPVIIVARRVQKAGLLISGQQ